MNKVFVIVLIAAVVLAAGIYYYVNTGLETGDTGGQEEVGGEETGEETIDNESGVTEAESERFDDSVGNASFVNATTTGAMYNATIAEYTFVPRIYGITKGTTVIWKNLDNVTHTVTSDAAVFDSGDLGKDGLFSYTFNEVGRYDYHCKYHSFMKGTFIVN